MTLKKVYLQSTICFKRVMLHWSKGFFHKYQIDFSKRSSYTCQIKSCHFFTLLPSDSVVEKVVLHFRLSPLLVLWSQSEEITQAVLSLHDVEVISISLCEPVRPDNHYPFCHLNSPSLGISIPFISFAFWSVDLKQKLLSDIDRVSFPHFAEAGLGGIY